MRWLLFAFLLAAFAAQYYAAENIAPLASLLASERHLDQSQIGLLGSAISMPMVVLGVAGGFIVDRIGVLRAVLVFTSVCGIGACMLGAANSYHTMLAGRFVFGIGASPLLVAVSAAAAQLFRDRDLGLAQALITGSAAAAAIAANWSPTWASAIYERGSQAVLTLAAAISLAGVAVAVGLCLALRHGRDMGQVGLSAERSVTRARAGPSSLRFGRAYWILVGVCTAFYGTLLPYLSTFGNKYLQDVHGLSIAEAGAMNGWVFAVLIVPAPLVAAFCSSSVRTRGALLVGSFLLPLAFACMRWMHLSPLASVALLCLAHAILPAALWPEIARTVRADRFGLAYGVVTSLQAAAVGIADAALGLVTKVQGASESNPVGYSGMLEMMVALGLVCWGFACWYYAAGARARLAARDDEAAYIHS